MPPCLMSGPMPQLTPAPRFTLPSYQLGGSAKAFAAVVLDSPPVEVASTIALGVSELLDLQLEGRLLGSEVGQDVFRNVVDRVTVVHVTDDERALSVARLLHPAAHMFPKQSLRMLLLPANFSGPLSTRQWISFLSGRVTNVAMTEKDAREQDSPATSSRWPL